MFINNLDPILFSAGIITVRWYGLLMVTGFTLYLLITHKLFKQQKLDTELLYALSFYLLLGVIIGARLGYVLFYNFNYYQKNWLDIFKIWQGGLASHGAAIGLVTAFISYYLINKKKFTKPVYKYVDILVIAMPLVAAFVRVGNFINSEILGRVTSLPWGVIFIRYGDQVPRHPVQLYECLLALLIFIILILTYKYFYQKTKPYFMTFLFVGLYFSTRFLVEFFKEYQIFDSGLTMGQWLSILPILISLIYFIWLIQARIKSAF